MDPAIITALISVPGGIILKAAYDGIRQWSVGKKDEAQRMATKLDEARIEAGRSRRLWYLWREHAHLVRRLLIDKGTPYQELPPIPEDQEN